MSKSISEKDELQNLLVQLDQSEAKHLDVAQYLVNAYGGAVYPLDLLAHAVLHRSLCLVSGFCLLIRSGNFVCAAPLVRLQMDNLIRFYASFLADDPHAFASRVLKGCEIRKLEDKTGAKMTDTYLVGRIAEEYPWATKVYRDMCGFIHLSAHHMHSTVAIGADGEGFQIVVDKNHDFIPHAIKLQIILTMTAITNAILRYVYGWGYTKDNPEVAEGNRQKQSDTLPGMNECDADTNAE